MTDVIPNELRRFGQRVDFVISKLFIRSIIIVINDPTKTSAAAEYSQTIHPLFHKYVEKRMADKG